MADAPLDAFGEQKAAARAAVNNALASARSMLGKNEVPDHDEIQSYLRDGGQSLDPHKLAWCAAFVSASLQKAGLPVPTQVIKGSSVGPGAYAGNYLTYGSAVHPGDIQAGDILVANDGSHVGFAEGPIRQGRNGPEVQLLAGNERDTSGRYAPGSYTNPATGAVAKRAQVGMVGERWVPLSQYSARRYEAPSDNATSSAPPAQGTTLNSTPHNDVIDQLSKNIAAIESGGFKNPYEAVNPSTHAIGKYQVMPFNVPGWTLAATGKQMTPEEFKASPEAQEAVFRDQMQRNLQLYGPKDAASIWFTGKPFNVAGGNVKDVGGTTNASYVARATKGINDDGTFTPGPAVAAAGATTPSASTGTTAAGPLAAPPNQSWWSKFTSKQTDPTTGKTTDSPLQQVAEAFSPSADKAKSAKEFMEEQAPERSMLSGGPGARNVSPGLMNVAQTYGQTLNSFNQPLTWNAAAPRLAGVAPAGFQPSGGASPYGTTLNSFQPPAQDLGYGIPAIGGYGFG